MKKKKYIYMYIYIYRKALIMYAVSYINPYPANTENMVSF